VTMFTQTCLNVMFIRTMALLFKYFH